jgi:hypothetical protein
MPKRTKPKARAKRVSGRRVKARAVSAAARAFPIKKKLRRRARKIKLDFLRLTRFLSADFNDSVSALQGKLRQRRPDLLLLADTETKKPAYYLCDPNFLAAKVPSAETLTVGTLLGTRVGELRAVDTYAGSLKEMSPKVETRIRRGEVFIQLSKDEPSAILAPALGTPSKVRDHIFHSYWDEAACHCFPGVKPSVKERAKEEVIFPKMMRRPSVVLEKKFAAKLEEVTAKLEEVTAKLEEEKSEGRGELIGAAASAERAEVPFEGVACAEGAEAEVEEEHVSPPEQAEGGAPSLAPPPQAEEPREEGPPAPPPEPPPVYPNIEVSSDHVLQGATFDVSVSLEFIKPEHTIGGAAMPPDETEYTVDVHLLVGLKSRWSQLKFKRPAGTTQKAEFLGVTAPALPIRDGTMPDRQFVDLAVNFYLLEPKLDADGKPVRSARWCGEALRRIEVLARPGVEPTPQIPVREQVPWREHLCVEPDAPPPDLLVRIKKIGERTFKWIILSPHMNFTGLTEENLTCDLSAAPEQFVRDHFEVFSAAVLEEQQMRRLDVACDLIYESTASGFRKAYWDLYLAARSDPEKKIKLETIQFVSDEPYVPWELMRVADDQRAPKIAPEILAVRHAVGRWVATDSCQLRQSLRVREIAVFATDYGTVARIKKKLRWALEELSYLVGIFKATAYRVRYRDLTEFFEHGRAQLIHFSCHGRTGVYDPENAGIELEEDDPQVYTAPQVWRPEVRRDGVGREKPVVFLNACQAGAAGEVLGMVFGWPQAFLRMGSTACVAPLWSVVDETAKDVATEFYNNVLKDTQAEPGVQPMTLGEALRQIRSQWRTKASLTYLGYVLYGDPTTKLDWQKPS